MVFAPNEEAAGIERGAEGGEDGLPMPERGIEKLRTRTLPNVLGELPPVLVAEDREPRICLRQVPQVRDGAVQVVLHHVLVDPALGILDVPLEISCAANRPAGGVEHAAWLKEGDVELGVADDVLQVHGGSELVRTADSFESFGGGNEPPVGDAEDLEPPLINHPYELPLGERLGHRRFLVFGKTN
jgi:hypothetical protein